MVYHFSYLTLRSYVLQNILCVYSSQSSLFVFLLWFIHHTFISNVHPLWKWQVWRHRHYSFTKTMSAYPRVFENISKAVQSPTKERLFYTPEIYLQNKANCQSQVSSSFLQLHPKAKGVQCVFFISQTPMVQFRCGATSAQISVIFMAAVIKIMPPSYMSHCISRKYLYACSELIT